MTHAEAHRAAAADPEGFWGEAAEAIHWEQPPARVFDDRRPPFYRWYTGGRLNSCFNALDRWVDGGRGIDRFRADQPALIYESPVTDTVMTFTYRELRDRVAHLAGALRRLGVGPGDRVVLYMPMVPEAVMGMLACARIGAVHSVVFGGFAPPELAVRIDDARPKVILSASCGIEVNRVIAYKPLLDRALEIAAHRPQRVVVLQRPMQRADLQPGRDLDWQDAVAGAAPAECVAVEATDPLYILYTSGTTGRPKGVVRDNGGHAVALRWSLRNVYGVLPGDVFWAASDVGWVVGHSYITYGPLLHGCTSVLYEGKPVGTPDAGAFWRVIRDHGVHVLFAAPTAMRAIRKEDPHGRLIGKEGMPSLRAIFLAGERLDPDTWQWTSERTGVPVIDHWWQTETGWPVAANCLGIEQIPIEPGSPGKPVPGYEVAVLDEQGRPTAPGQTGAIAIRLPLPPGCLPSLWNDDERFVASYLSRYPGYYETGDEGFFDDDGYLYVMGRADDVINVAGHRLSTGAMEEIVSTHPAVAECAVIGVPDALRGEVPLGLVVLADGARAVPDEVERDLVALVRERLGAVACFRRALFVSRLPKTRSGKILRGAMRRIAAGKPVETPSTIEDPAALDEVARALRKSLA